MRLLAALALAAALARAGGGPETTLLVVNADSPVSRRIANEYASLRRLPQSHILYLEAIPTLRILSMAQFRGRILGPILSWMRSEGLEESIDCIVYSADFPYGVDLNEPLKDREAPQYVTKVASLTGMTFLGRRVEKELWEEIVDLGVSRYYRREMGRATRNATAEERNLYGQAMAALQRGDHATAAESYRRFLETFRDHVESWYNYACCLARLGKVDEAMAALREAAGRGYNDAAHAGQDPDLEPLRGRPDFVGLLRDMAGRVANYQKTIAFTSRLAWTGADDPVEDASSLDRYWLSTMLAYTGEWGNSLPEALAALRPAATCDGANPDGTFYFCQNGDVRSTTRQGAFPSIVAALRAMGRKAEILEAGKDGQTGILPVGKNDVIGACIGSAGFSWAECKSIILPGAICEHLTSHGGDFAHGGQTKLSELVRYGAAGASGTVCEPFAIQNKFPHPAIYLHYARGCSLAESFYQSLWGPYQLLVVGDPLARPFARFGKVEVDPGAQPWKGTVKVSASSDVAGARIEFWLDGRRVEETIDTTRLDDGAHDLRAVAVEPGDIATRSFAQATVFVANAGRAVEVQTPKSALFGQPLELRGRALLATGVEVLQGTRVVATAKVESGSYKVAVPTETLGAGPVTLVVRGRYETPPMARSAPVPLVVEEAVLLKAPKADGPRLPGLRGKDSIALQLARSSGEFSGEIELPRAGRYELILSGGASLAVDLNGRQAFLREKGDGQVYLPLAGEAGWYPIRVRGTDVTMLLAGEQVAAPPNLRSIGRPAVAEPLVAEGAFTELVDGRPIGNGLLVPAAGVELSFKKGPQEVGGVLLHGAAANKDSKPWPPSWVVEAADAAGKFKPVANLVAVAAPAAGNGAIPALLELTFKPVRTKKFRVKPGGDGAAMVTEIAALGKAPKG